MTIAGWLGETRVEAAASGSSDVGPNTVEDPAGILIDVETVVDKGAQKTATLRDAEPDGSLDILVEIAERAVHAAVLEIGHSVADGSRAETDQHRVLGFVDDLIDF